MPQIGSKGEELDLLIRQGATLKFVVTATTGDGLPLDITGAEIRSQIRKTPEAVDISATAVIDITDATGGVFSVEFTDEETALLDPSPIDENQPQSLYYWDIEIEFLDATIMALLYGKVRVFREITR